MARKLTRQEAEDICNEFDKIREEHIAALKDNGTFMSEERREELGIPKLDKDKWREEMIELLMTYDVKKEKE